MTRTHLSPELLNEIRQAFSARKIVYSKEVRQLLTRGLGTDYVLSLPVFPGPSYQLLNDLRNLNSVVELESGQVPLKVWLENGIEVFSETDTAGLFKKALAELDGSSQPQLVDAPAAPGQTRIAAEPDPLEPFLSFDELVIAHTSLLQSGGDNKEKVREFIKRGVLTGARIDDTDARRTAQSLLNYWLTVLYRIDEQPPPDAVLAYYEPPSNLGFDSSACPYIGLSPFREEDKDAFFGREVLTETIVQRLHEIHLVVLVGPSGSGKTSVLNAGVLPRLKTGEELNSKDWVYFPPFTPGSEPLKNLAALFTEDVDSLAEKLSKQPEHLLELMNESTSENQPAVLIVDQFEELFTICKDDQQRNDFQNALLSLTEPLNKHRIILLMRSDQVNQLIRRPKLNDLFRHAEMRVYPLREAELHEVIKKPADKIGLKFEPGVVEQLLREIFGDPIGLPLLQFALLELWADRECNKITWGAMNRLGTCREALVRKAGEFYGRLSPDEKNMVRRILLKMVRLSDTWEAATEPVRLEELYQSGETRECVNLVLRKLLDAHLARISNVSCRHLDLSVGLITADLPPGISPDHQFEIAHQSLARYWPMITEWFTDLRESLVIKRRLELFASNWGILGHGDHGLMDKYQLHEAEIWLASAESKELGYDPDVKALALLSRQVINREKRIRFAVLTVMVTVILVLIGLMMYADHTRLKVATSSRLALEADSLKENELDVALLLSLEALRKDDDNPAVQNALMRAVTYSLALTTFLDSKGDPAKQIWFSSDGQQLFALDEAGQTLRAWDTRSHVLETEVNTPIPRKQVVPERGAQRDYLLSVNGRNLLFMTNEGAMVSWNRDTKQQFVFVPNIKTTKTFALLPAAYSHDSEKLVVINDLDENKAGTQIISSELSIWDLKSQKKLISKVFTRLSEVAFSPDDKTLAAATPEGNILLFRVADLSLIGKPLTSPSVGLPTLFQIAFSGDGSRLAFLHANETLTVWNLANQKSLGPFVRGAPIKPKSATQPQSAHSQNDPRTVTSFALDQQGRQMVAGYQDGSVVFWNVDEQVKREYSDIHKAEVRLIAISPDDRQIVTVADNGPPAYFERSETFGSAPFEFMGRLLPGHIQNISTVAFAPDSKLIAAASEAGTTVLWNLDQRLPGNEVRPKGSGDPSALSSEGKLFLLDHDDQISEFDLGQAREVGKFSLKLDWLREGESSSTLFFNQSRAVLVVFYFGNSIGVWDLKTRTFKGNITTIPGQNKYGPLIQGLALDSEGRKLAVASNDGKIVIWDLNTSSSVSFDYGKTESVTLALSPDGTKLASCDDSGVLSIWDTASGKPIREGIQTKFQSFQLEFTRDGSKLLQRRNTELTLWDVASGEKPLWKSPDISRFVINPVKDELAVTTSAGAIAFLNLADGKEQYRFPATEIEKIGRGNPLTSLVYGPKGAYLIVGYFDGSVSSIWLDTKTWTQRACAIANRPLNVDEQTTHKLFEEQSIARLKHWLWPEPVICPSHATSP